MNVTGTTGDTAAAARHGSIKNRTTAAFDATARRTMSVWRRLPSSIRDAAPCALLVITFLAIEPSVERSSRHPEWVFRSLPAVGAAVVDSSTTAAVWAVALSIGWFRRRTRWPDYGPGAASMRIITVASTVCVGWSLILASFNYWHGTWMATERVILAAAVTAAAWRPGWLPLATAATYLLAGQYHEPLRHSWTDREMVFHTMLWASIWVGWRGAMRDNLAVRHFLTVVCGSLAAWFVLPAWGKWELNWLAEESLANLTAAARYQNGWLGGLSEETFGRLIGGMTAVNTPMLWATLLLESAMLLLLLSRRLTAALLLGCIGLHAGIYASSGVFFWKWMVVEAAVAAAVWRYPPNDLCGFRRWGVSAAVCVAMIAWSDDPVKLAWFDEPLAYRFRMTATDRGGREFQVSAADMAPYDFPFAQARFYFAVDRPRLCDCFGCNPDVRLHRWLAGGDDAAGGSDAVDGNETAGGNDSAAGLDRGTPAGHRETLARFGSGVRDDDRRRRLEELFRRYLRYRGGGRGWAASILDRVGAPDHIGSAPRPDDPRPALCDGISLTGLRMDLHEAWTGDGPPRTLHRETVMHIRAIAGPDSTIDSGPATGSGPAADSGPTSRVATANRGMRR